MLTIDAFQLYISMICYGILFSVVAGIFIRIKG